MDLPDDISIRWGRAGDADPLARHLREWLGPGRIVVGRLCPRCGSDRHGTPWASHDGASVQVSLARSGPNLLSAASRERRLGVDLEQVAAVATRWQPELVLADGERADDDPARARLWAAKEAVLKALGTGLATPMASVRVAEHETIDLQAPPGLVAVLATAPAARDAAARRRRGR